MYMSHTPTYVIRTSTNLLHSDEESEPTVGEYLSRFKPSLSAFQRYIRSLFPFWDWIFHYNLTWLFGDFIAGK